MKSEADLFDELLEHTVRTANSKLADERGALKRLASKKLIRDAQERAEILDSLLEQCSDLKAAIQNGAAAGRIAMQAYCVGRIAAVAQVGKDAKSGWRQRKSGEGNKAARIEEARFFGPVIDELLKKGQSLSSACRNAISRWNKEHSEKWKFSTKTTGRRYADIYKKNRDKG